jgi:hypothetical protein
MRKVTSVFCLAVISTVAAIAGDCSGRWQGKMSIEGKDVPGYFVLKQDGQQVSGTAGPNAQNQIALKQGSVEGDQVTLEAAPGDAVLRFVLGFKEDKLTGDVFENGTKIGTAAFIRANE